jgi:tRNA(fMet)-specific endonuclease VapC
VEQNLERLREFFSPFDSLPFDDDAAERYGVIRAQLRREGNPIGANDMLIAAIALTADVAVVTRNRQEFRRVAGLRVETW